MANKNFVKQTSTGEPVEINDLTVYPVARSYRINMPGVRGGFIWNRPVAVIVEDSAGNRQVLPVVDRTRLLQIAIFSAGLLGTLLTWIIFRKSR
jgi:hypothetical protein